MLTSGHDPRSPGPTLSVTAPSPAQSPLIENSELPILSQRHEPSPPVPRRARATSSAASSALAIESPGPRSSRAPSPAQETLPELPKYPGSWDTLSSSSDTRRANSAYFTAVWGSPYATPSPRRPSWTLSRHSSLDAVSSDGSPSSQRRGHSSLRAASASSQLRRHLQGPESLGRSGGQSIRQFTEDWINQYLSGQLRTERSNWLSDDDSSETPSFFTARNYFADDPSDGWLGLSDEQPDEDDPLKTPTLHSVLAKRQRLDKSSTQPQRSLHRHLESTVTLKQEHIWGLANSNESQQGNMTEIRDGSNSPAEEGSGAGPMPPTEKPLPPPPPTDGAPDGPESIAPNPSKAPATATGTSSQQRTRKKLVWRGKACYICVPADDKRGSEESGYPLLTPADVEERLQKWRDEGYNVNGFDVYVSEDEFPYDLEGGISRKPFPDPIEAEQEKQAGHFEIRFPDLEEWEEYVKALREEKLRALGVSVVEDEPPATVSPASLAAMTHFHGYPGLITSPPVPTSSAASNPLLNPHAFSPHLNQSSNPSTNPGSLTSPAPQFGAQGPVFGVDGNLVAGLSYPFQPTPPAAGTFTPQSLLNARQGGISSAGPNNILNYNTLLSPVSPINGDDPNQFQNLANDFQVQNSGRDSGRATAHHVPQDSQNSRASQADTLILEEAQPDAEHFQTSNVELVQPRPRGHSHNISDTLQKGLDRYGQPDYQFESVNEPTADLRKSRWPVTTEEMRPSTLHSQFHGNTANGHHRFFGDQQADDQDEIDTNPSLAGSPREAVPDMSQHPWHAGDQSVSSFTRGHKSKSSASGLNVEAKEFNPSSSFGSGAFTFQGNSFQPGRFDNSAGFSPVGTTFNSGKSHGFNVAAPAFTPGSSAFAPKDFTFSAASFNVDAPTFDPSRGLTSTSTTDGPSHLKSSIFGDVDLSQITKPPKESKAIPIVRPDERERNATEKKGETQGDSSEQSRQKRVRRGAGDGDKEAEFATPTPLGEAAQVQASSPNKPSKPSEGKENEAPEEVQRTADSSSDAKRPFVDDTVEAKDVSKPAEAPKEEVAAAQEQETIKEVPPQETKPSPAEEKPLPELPKTEETAPAASPDDSAAPSDNKDTAESAAKPAAEPPKPARKKSIFSAFTRPFSFRASVAEFIPSSQTSTPAQAKTEPAKSESEKPAPEKQQKTGFFGSRNAPASPPGSPKMPAETELSPIASVKESKDSRDDGQFVEERLPRKAEPVESDSPDVAEIDAVMEALNRDDNNIGVERISTPPPPPPAETPMAVSTGQPRLLPVLRSEEMSPSPRGGADRLVNGMPVAGPNGDSRAQHNFASGHSPIRQLVSMDNHISDWDDMISSGEEEKLYQRSRFFDRHVNDLLAQALEDRLGPLEEALSVIQHSIVSMGSRRRRRSVSVDVENSDADDEDDEAPVHRPISPFSKKDKKLEKIKNAVTEVITTHLPRQQEAAAANHLAAIQESIAELKALTAKPNKEEPDIRSLLQEVITAHFSNKKLTEAEEIGADSLKMQVDGLKSMLRVADERMEQEMKGRRDAQEALSEVQKMLRYAEDEATRYRKAAEEAEANLRHLREEKIPEFEKIQMKSEVMEKQQRSWELTLRELSEKNIQLEAKLDEYRESHDHWKKRATAMEQENKDLRASIGQLQARLEDSMRARQSLRGKFDRIQNDIINVTHDVAKERATARRKEEELNAKYEALKVAYDREVKLREKLDTEIAELEKHEHEATKLRVMLSQMQHENARLEEMIENLRHECLQYQSKAAHFEREFKEARETSLAEIKRTRTSLEADIDAANNQVNIVRAELESQITRLENQLEHTRLDADTMKERYELLLEEARENKANAIAELNASREAALEEQRKMHDRALNDLRERHARAMHNASEDRQRIENHMAEQIKLANERADFLQDKVTHLEEKLEIAKSAARAAAQAAQAKGTMVSPPPTGASHHPSSPSLSYKPGSDVPERISPQALRESILVLQDQLQQREARIEELEQQLESVDRDAPKKLKEKDSEINWLRELLGVRVDDLQDIINILSQPSFDQQAVRDAAIRLKANLEMEQQERERAMAGGKTFPSLSELAASPRSLPLAAAAAWGSWRKGRDSVTPDGTAANTPSKSNGSGGFLSGLLTPPSSNLRQLPRAFNAPGGRANAATDQRRGSGAPKAYNASPRPLSSQQAGKAPVREEPPEPPRTPPLLRRGSYDHDAEPNNYDSSALMEDGDSDFGETVESPKETPGDALAASSHS